MNDRKPPCVFPSLSEMELATLEGEPGAAMRIRVEPHGADGEGYVRLEQMAWSVDMGWYCQKSFIIPAAMVRGLITTLRKADCLLPKPQVDPLAPIPFCLTPVPHDPVDSEQRRDA